ncbi:MAG: phenylalanine--tRNA ligase subunit beta [Patescibacteria group bacterium]|nr:phenylalanine--tRNA ligase subunit beta [Patescibacteria group bacterium]
MKILYSQLKELVPQLKASPQIVGETLTLTGFMMDSLEKVQYQGKTDYLIGLEVRQNRADCLSILGIAREVAAYWGLECRDLHDLVPKIKQPTGSAEIKDKSSQEKIAGKGLTIEIRDKEPIRRILAVEITNLKNKQSPSWLKEFLSFYEINSINFPVDLSNYVMLLTGYPSHLLDKSKIQGELIWSLNKNFKEITTLDNSKIKLEQKEELIIQDQTNILALAGIVGGKVAATDQKTTSIVAEMAIYDRALIRKNSNGLKVVTEASNRLEKDLDTTSSSIAFELLTSLIIKHCGGELVGKVFDFYPQKRKMPVINLNLQDPSSYAGIEISPEKTGQILEDLRFKVKKNGNNLQVSPPSDRMDINMEEDVIEEVVRIVGYDKIPVDQPPKLTVVKNITPQVIKLTDSLKDMLIALGFDEILSSPLIKKEANADVNYQNWKVIATQNSVNEEYPDLRQSMAPGLIHQLEEYVKKGIDQINIFEIGKIFGQINNHYHEQESLGLLTHKSAKEKGLSQLQQATEKLLRTSGINDVRWLKSKTVPTIANPYSCWDLIVGEKIVGILYKLKSIEKLAGSTYFAEINLSDMTALLKHYQPEPTTELTKKIVTLDVNLEFPIGKKQTPEELINKKLQEIRQKISKDNLWSLKIHDIFPLKNKIRYTVRVSYKELSDPQAKKLHSEVFGGLAIIK